ncbi:MAG: nicotinate-nucleotide adenylyltransferase [Chloroflexi bacterium]|nr:nicotinate-nucleotide adenylyltransferase [Chloroflexota bacterium]
MTTRLGLLGGTFDPPHYGHLLAAQEVAWHLDLERVLFLPARQNPLKQHEATTDAHHRCEMVRLAIEGNPLFELSRLDLDRPPPSFTIDLLRALANEARELFFIVGADILPELPLWHAPGEILRLARLVAVNRPGSPQPDVRALDARLPGAGTRVDLVSIPGVDISSTDLRQRARVGRPLRYFTPPSVEAYIQEHAVYGPD